MSALWRKIKLNMLVTARKAFRYRGTWLRASFCLLVGLGAYLINTTYNYDLRYRARGKAQPQSDVVIIELSSQEWIQWNEDIATSLSYLNDVAHLPDSFFWNTELWQDLLQSILKQNPKLIISSFYFDKQISDSVDINKIPKEFTSPKVIWSSRLDQEGRLLIPSFVSHGHSNVGLTEIKVDNDGIVRNFSSPLAQVPHIALKVAKKLDKKTIQSGTTKSINYQGPKNTFSHISMSSVLMNRISPEFLKDKIVIIGSKDSESHSYLTPVGKMSRAELLANIVDNILGDKWIVKVPDWTAVLIHCLILILSILIMSNYPQFASFILFSWIGVCYASLSIWIFDQFYIWTPVFSVFIQLFTSFIIFLSFRLTVKDYQTWQLQQEKKYLLEIEQLKNNFVSLFSHDLKTPIAKIQAICDRMIANSNGNQQINKDLQLLRNESSELHRYIQSILQVTRVQSRDFKLIKNSSDINEVVENVIKLIQPLAKHKNISIEAQLEPMFLIEMDENLIREVILNLVENAVKYTPEGGKIMITTSEDNDNVVVRVRDNGPGIPEEEQELIFDKFYRGNSEKHKSKGSGLGLYLTKYFVELHGGKVHLDSAVNKGTEVEFKLPV